jgi:hypothetical protein
VNWATIGIDASELGGTWPTSKILQPYRGRVIEVHPEDQDNAPRLYLECDSAEALESALKLLQQFLSALAYHWDLPIPVIMQLGGSSRLGVGRGRKAPPYRPPHHPQSSLGFVPETSDPRALLALALYREALNQDSYPFKFLSLYKIVNILYEKGPDQIDWINAATAKIRDSGQGEYQRLQQLRSQKKDVGKYLYESGRCAVAHAFAQPLVDPDDPADTLRLGVDCSLMKAVARYAIRYELGVSCGVGP